MFSLTHEILWFLGESRNFADQVIDRIKAVSSCSPCRYHMDMDQPTPHKKPSFPALFYFSVTLHDLLAKRLS